MLQSRRGLFVAAFVSALIIGAPGCVAQDPDPPGAPPGQAGPETRGNTASFAGKKLALLIGIARYSGTGWAPLDGPENDVEMLKEVLQSRQFGFSASDITTLVNEAATLTAIREAFEKLAQGRSPEDIVYIHYSGHGSRVEDRNGDEAMEDGGPGRDSTLVPFDARSSGSREIVDEELKLWINRIRAATPNVTLVVDACHSGSLERSPVSAKVRRTESADDASKYAFADAQLLEALDESETRIRPDDRYVRISASRDSQTAREYAPRGSSKFYGLLTYYWARALKDSAGGDTYGTAFTRASAGIRSNQGMRQQPVLEGAGTAQLFSGRIGAARSELAVSRVDDSDIWFDGGLLRGVTEGSIYEKRDAGAAGGASGALARITRVRVGKSEAELLDGAAAAVGDLFIEKEHVFPFPELRVYLWDDRTIPGGAARWIDALRAQIPAGVELVGEDGVADMILRFTRGSDGHVCEFLDSGEGPYGEGALEPSLLRPSLGDDVGATAEDLAFNIRRIENNLSLVRFIDSYADRLAQAEIELLRLTAPGEDDPVEIFFDRFDDAEDYDDPRIHLEVVGAEQAAELPAGSVIAFRVHNRSTAKLHFFMVNLNPSGAVTPMYGRGDGKDVLVEAGKTRYLEPIGLDEGAGLLDRYLWIISEHAIDTWRLKGEPLRTRDVPWPGDDAGPSKVLNDLMTRVADVRQRGNRLRVDRMRLATRRFEIETN